MDLIHAQIFGNLLRRLATIAGQHDDGDPGRFEACDRPRRRRLHSVRHARKRNHLPCARREYHRFPLTGQSLCRRMITRRINPGCLHEAFCAKAHFRAGNLGRKAKTCKGLTALDRE